jgi:hypothetical protein
MKLPYQPKKKSADFMQIQCRWKIEPKLKVNRLQECVKILTLPAEDENSLTYIHIEPKVQKMGRFANYWAEFYAGSGIHEINVRAYFNDLEELTAFGGGLARYGDAHSEDLISDYSKALVDQLAKLFSFDLILEE